MNKANINNFIWQKSFNNYSPRPGSIEQMQRTFSFSLSQKWEILHSANIDQIIVAQSSLSRKKIFILSTYTVNTQLLLVGAFEAFLS